MEFSRSLRLRSKEFGRHDLAGLADPRLAKALTAMFDDPTHPWGLSEMAGRAGMSRARFAVHFREVTGDTPADFLASWRITLAQDLLRSGRPLKHVAQEVGYGSASALTRAFVRKIGQPPSRWMRNDEESAEVARAGCQGRRGRARNPGASFLGPAGRAVLLGVALYS